MIFSGAVTIYSNICKIPEISLPPCISWNLSAMLLGTHLIDIYLVVLLFFCNQLVFISPPHTGSILLLEQVRNGDSRDDEGISWFGSAATVTEHPCQRGGCSETQRENRRIRGEKCRIAGWDTISTFTFCPYTGDIFKRLVTTCHSFWFIVLFGRDTGRNRRNGTLLLHGCCRLEATEEGLKLVCMLSVGLCW
jgi:hypothetical protein